METIHETNFTIMPKHTNYHQPLVFGGALFSEMDLCAAMCASKLLRSSPTANTGVTFKADVTFHGPSFQGDIIYIRSEVVELRKKGIRILTTAHREPRDSEERTHIATIDFVFVSMHHEDGKEPYYSHHQLELPNAE